MALRLEGLTVDCRDKHALAAFWCELLGTTVRGEAGQYLGLEPVAAGHPRLVFQQLDGPLRERGRLHLDLEVDDLEAETARALALGAELVEVVDDLDTRWHVLRDPEGNLFCLVPA
jgi:catechol 2,3-dioxygenase-like lactoylglutathione lyase family enzyme